ncbi:MAG: ferrous iron transport protein B [Verrucomicrobia bacterium]|nr:ferrous iron transport protein B [Cytophagales bacterium]
MKNIPLIALVGNPNSGKSTLFNQLTGLSQKTGNFPGVTVDKHLGSLKLSDFVVTVMDLPGTYSLYPKSLDEKIVIDILANPADDSYPDLVVVVADASNLKRNLLLFTELKDLGLPVLLALNMLDVAKQQGIKIDETALAEELRTTVIPVNARNGNGMESLKFAINQALSNPKEDTSVKGFFLTPADSHAGLVAEIKSSFELTNDYLAWQYAHQGENFYFLNKEQKKILFQLTQQTLFPKTSLQAGETVARYMQINSIIGKVQKHSQPEEHLTLTQRIDKILLHRFWGYLVFLFILFLMFQAVFTFAQYPMDLIDGGIAAFSNLLKNNLPPSKLVDLLTDGIIAGIGGVVVFIPQIAVLFALIALLEESGYMARVMFIMDKIMRKFGLNGKSVVPLISGVACAVPAIMATRNIDNWKERLITIFVTPLMSCSARIPVYTILIALVVPQERIWGFINLQGLALMAMYLLGFLAAIGSAWAMNLLLKNKQKSYFIMELPTYKMPKWKNIGLVIIEKVRTFVLEAGKVILAVSIILWVLASYGPGDAMQQAETQAQLEGRQLTPEAFENYLAAKKLSASYAGHFGKFIEPAIKPLGYDWKIGIALLTSLAAREVFVGTVSTIYSLGQNDEVSETLKARMKAEMNPETGKPMYTPALAFSLLVFYAFAMQCMSTLAATYRETKNWKYPVAQFFYMTGLAYLAAFVVYSLIK